MRDTRQSVVMVTSRQSVAMVTLSQCRLIPYTVKHTKATDAFFPVHNENIFQIHATSIRKHVKNTCYNSRMQLGNNKTNLILKSVVIYTSNCMLWYTSILILTKHSNCLVCYSLVPYKHTRASLNSNMYVCKSVFQLV